jgi:hypothetical protein
VNQLFRKYESINASESQSSWLQIQRSWFDSRHYHIFWEVVGLERCPLSLVSTTEELLGRNSSGSSLQNRDYGCRDPPVCPRDTSLSTKVGTNSVTNGGRSVGIVSSLRPMSFFFFWEHQRFTAVWASLAFYLILINTEFYLVKKSSRKSEKEMDYELNINAKGYTVRMSCMASEGHCC